jgi:glycine/D-amino acid oxidase-like deaminating enzyme
VNEHCDVVVIGGGIVGAACAYYLAKAGVSVRVLERDFAASGTSRACDGLILYSDKLSEAELALAKASANLWEELASSLDSSFEYLRRGTIVLYESEEGLSAGRQKARDLQAAGVRTEILDGIGLRSLEPNLAADLAGGIFYLDEAQVDSRLATLAMLDAAQILGVSLASGTTVTGIRLDSGGRVCAVKTAQGDVPARVVICAAGVWSSAIARSAGIQLPVQPRKGHILVTGRIPQLIAHPLLEGSYAASVKSSAEEVQVALVAERTAGDTMLLGSSREFAGFDRAVSPTVIQAIAARAVRFLPRLAQTSVMRSYAGLRPWSPDHLPLIGPVDTVPGLYLATGHEGAGVGLAPITGRILAQCIVEGKAPPLAEPVRPGRFELLQDERRSI